MDRVIPDKVVKVYPNSKPWVSKSLKVLLNRKRRAFREGDLPQLHRLKREVKSEIRRAKQCNKAKREQKFSNLGSAWDGMQTITGTHNRRNRKVALEGFGCDKQLDDVFS